MSKEFAGHYGRMDQPHGPPHQPAYVPALPGVPGASLPGASMVALPTVRIVSDETADGFMIINASDFDAKKHTLAPGETLPPSDPSTQPHKF